jgi:hypothetical protein
MWVYGFISFNPFSSRRGDRVVKEWRDKAYGAESECSIDDLTRLRVPSILNEGGGVTHV